jgi:Zn-dependent protease with chaperone function
MAPTIFDAELPIGDKDFRKHVKLMSYCTIYAKSVYDAFEWIQSRLGNPSANVFLASVAIPTSLTLILQKLVFRSAESFVSMLHKGKLADGVVAASAKGVVQHCNLPGRVKVYIIPSTDELDAFVLGDPRANEDHPAIICISQGLIDKLTKAELHAVIAHECAHLFYSDVIVGGSFVAMVAGCNGASFLSKHMSMEFRRDRDKFKIIQKRFSDIGNQYSVTETMNELNMHLEREVKATSERLDLEANVWAKVHFTSNAVMALGKCNCL